MENERMMVKEKSNDESGEHDGRQFCWGLSLGTIQLYESFTFDGVEYRLYDCAYMWRSGQDEPDIGKIVKIWRTASDEKKVEVVWFFRPFEINHWLGDIKPIRGEIFLACGEGKGLSNINQLEAICGKCNVICASKDPRNSQPTEEELRNADFIFYRTFDVGKYTISEDLPSTIGGVEVDHFFNRGRDTRSTVAVAPKPRLKIRFRNFCSHPVSEPSLPLTRESDSAKPKNGFKVPAAPISRETNHLTKDRPPNGAKVEVPKHPLPANPSAFGPTKKPKLLDDALPGTKARHSESPKLSYVKDSGKGSLPKRVHVHSAKKVCKFSEEATDSEQILIPKINYQQIEVTRRPDADASKWLKLQCRDEERLSEAHLKGTLVLLENLDPSFTSAEVEDIVWHAFQQKVKAKMVQHTTFCTPHSGKAFILFKSKETADEAMARLANGCLVLGDGRPIVGRRRLLRKPGVSSGFVGHLSIERTRAQRQREEIRNAVSTSHFSQANTIEYEMAIHWCSLQTKSDIWWSALYEEQGKQIEQLMKQMKIHHTD